ncbi:hypothetical protein G7B40_009060 [Aetokthonos hydrillicola Thurmond2011]|jgi:hypothetical protein|uniref:Uncharacterized protein n=1 Tax=Aetokthonos hydrillicola Thurmond2011 TaxID=2712845 RepID=A0AAP5I6U4_9CYAN|nr:hypothetical protein [Aetokthonos hydrillicola]MBO3457601.1 hypothetical protein [Aetokthonos hydrillicola CCALA 1050]MBW4587879.1 hypothetical protein [Aetokthonos hydrillicola CCALA 1050]MDR9894717.1 hypothetical protein [Aetokthonos hydrillicola Thurmond2011]
MNTVKLLFCISLVAYACFLIINPQFWIIDDHVFLNTIQIGKSFIFVNNENGRFEPLNTQEYYLLSKFFPPTPTLYWAFNAFQLILFTLIVYKIIKRITNNTNFTIITLFFLLLLPGFTLAWSRFIVGERGAIFCSAVFIYSYFSYLEEKNFKQSLIPGFISLIFANLALYYKEPTFLAIGTFSFFHLIFSWKTSKLKIKILDILLLISCSVFVIIYIVYVYLNTSSSYSESHKVVAHNLNFFSFYKKSDPILLFGLLPFTACRIYQVLVKKRPVEPIYDSMLLAATIYVSVFFRFHIYSQYYLLPAYIFAIPALVFFFTKVEKNLTAWRRWSVIALAGFLLTTTLPQGFNNLISHKNETINFNQMLSFIVHDITTRYPNQRASIFLDGVSRGTGIELYHSLAEFLEYRGLTTQQFNLKSDLPIDNHLLFSQERANPPSPYTVFQTDNVEQISTGDYLLVTPYSTKPFSPSYLASLKQNYELLFQTHSQFSIEIANLFEVIKKYVLKKNIASDSRDFYIFLHK